MTRKDPFKVTPEERDKMPHADLNSWYADYGIKVDDLAKRVMSRNDLTGLIFCGGKIVKKLKNYEKPSQEVLATLEKKYCSPCFMILEQAEELECAKKVILKKLPEYSVEERGKVGNLVVLVTKFANDAKVPIPSEMYIGKFVADAGFLCDKRLDNIIKLTSVGRLGAYEVTEVDTVAVKGPVWPLTKEGIAYLRKSLPDYFKT